MKKTQQGIFITLEGTEGSGKSTLISHLGQKLPETLAKTRPIVITREPGGSPLAEEIRELVLGTSMDPRTELLLYEAARAEHVAKTIVPALAKGAIVLCDRFTDSTLAYQSHARGLPWKEVVTLNKIATAGLIPDLTIFLDIDPAKGLERARDPNRFEAEGVDFQKKVRLGFLKSRKEKPGRFLTLKVEGRTPEQLSQAVLEHLKKKFKILGRT